MDRRAGRLVGEGLELGRRHDRAAVVVAACECHPADDQDDHRGGRGDEIPTPAVGAPSEGARGRGPARGRRLLRPRPIAAAAATVAGRDRAPGRRPRRARRRLRGRRRRRRLPCGRRCPATPWAAARRAPGCRPTATARSRRCAPGRRLRARGAPRGVRRRAQRRSTSSPEGRSSGSRGGIDALQVPAHGGERAPDLRLDGAERPAGAVGDLLVGEVGPERQLDGLPCLGPQQAQALAQGEALGQAVDLQVVDGGSARAPARSMRAVARSRRAGRRPPCGGRCR